MTVWQSGPVHVWNTFDQVPEDFGPSVVAIGNFDGVHAGHQEVLASVVRIARERGATSVAITFHPHPVRVLHPDRAPHQITGQRDKINRLAETGLDAVLDMEFTHDLARQTPEEFVRSTFVETLRSCVAVVGQDIRFGYQNSGDLVTMRELGKRFGFEVWTLDDVHGGVNGADPHRRWSSSWARELIDRGEVKQAAEILTRPHHMRGVVVHGDHRGRELGYPTANLAQDSAGMVPADGIYAGWLTPQAGPERDNRLPAAISVGTNPTFEGTQRRVESYVLDRSDLDLYGTEVVVEFVERLRPTLRFDGLEPLVTQMKTDVVQTRMALGLPMADQSGTFRI